MDGRLKLQNNMDEILKLYNDEKLPIAAIARRFVSNFTAVRNALLISGQKLRKQGPLSSKTPWYGKHLTEEMKAKISRALKGHHNSPFTEFKKGLEGIWRGKHLTTETKAKISIASKAYHTKPEIRARQSARMKGKKLRLGHSHTAATRTKLSISMKAQYQNPELRARRIAAIMKGLNIKPNKAELKLQDFLNRHFPSKWRYVGDGQINIGGYFPDFINVDGKKEVIELFGEHWHPIFDIAVKKEHYRQYGFRVAIIWEDELKDEPMLIEVFRRKFRGGK